MQVGQRDMWVSELTPLTPDLESVFLQLTGTTPEPGAPVCAGGHPPLG